MEIPYSSSCCVLAFLGNIPGVSVFVYCRQQLPFLHAATPAVRSGVIYFFIRAYVPCLFADVFCDTPFCTETEVLAYGSIDDYLLFHHRDNIHASRPFYN
jgi:hypothetical protein